MRQFSSERMSTKQPVEPKEHGPSESKFLSPFQRTMHRYCYENLETDHIQRSAHLFKSSSAGLEAKMSHTFERKRRKKRKNDLDLVEKISVDKLGQN